MDSVHHIWCPLSSQEYQDLPDGAETTLTLLLNIRLVNVPGPRGSQLTLMAYSSSPIINVNDKYVQIKSRPEAGKKDIVD